MEINELELMTTEEVSRFLRISEITLWRMRKKGEIPFNRIGGKIRFRRTDIARFLEKNVQNGFELVPTKG